MAINKSQRSSQGHSYWSPINILNKFLETKIRPIELKSYMKVRQNLYKLFGHPHKW